MATATTSGNVGERIITRWLAEHGYSASINTRGPGATDIEARGNSKSLLVHVKSAVQPNSPAPSPSDEVLNITSRGRSPPT